jgi:hypothetical protein
LVLTSVLFGAQPLNAREKEARRFSFVVIGHVRSDENGKLSPLLDELMVKVRRHSPDLIFLTGDMIWGDVHADVPDADVVKRDWDRLDATLKQLRVPVYRVPGNHDIHDPVTRDIYFARYGELPMAFTHRGSRLILLNSSWTPEGNEPSSIKRQYTRGKQLGAKQIEFIRSELSESQRYDHVFLFMHHLLWWHRQEAAWWRDVHPLLVGRNVRAVFGGDFGPVKFSHMRRDGIDYLQSSIEGIPSIKRLRALISSRLLSQQFDNYLYVTVNGEHVTVNVETLGEMSLGKFTPEVWRAVDEYVPPEKPVMMRLWDADVLGSPRRLGAFALLMVGCFLGGFVAALMFKRYKKA